MGGIKFFYSIHNFLDIIGRLYDGCFDVKGEEII